MKEVSGRYIRPLLNCTREDINAFVAQNSLLFVEDETNADTAYTRNFIRAELSRIKEKFPYLCTSVSRLCQNANEICDYIDKNTPSLKLENGEVAVNVKCMDGSLEGKELDVLIEGRDEEQPNISVGRSYREAPEVDGQVYVENDADSKPGDIVRVRVLQGFTYDVVGERIDGAETGKKAAE